MIFLSDCFVIHFHVVINSLLIAKMVIIFHFTILQQAMRSDILFFLLLYILSLLTSGQYFAIFIRTVIGSCRVLLLDLYLRIGVAKCG